MGIFHDSLSRKLAGVACGLGLLAAQPALASFVPPQSDDLVMWFDATQGALDGDGNDVTQTATESTSFVTWEDQSGNGNHLTPVTEGEDGRWRPEAGDFGMSNGTGPLVDLRSASLDYGPLAVDLDEPFSSDAVTVFAIHNYTVSNSWSRAWEMYEDGGRILSGRYARAGADDQDDQMWLQDEQDGVMRAQDDRIDTNSDLNLYTSIANGSNSAIHFWAQGMDASELGDAGDLSAHSGHLIDRVELPQASGGSSFQAFIVYDTVLSEEDRQQVEQHLASQFSIPEPGSLALLGCGGLAMLLRRRG